jgi:hypothetical protein
MPRPSCGRYSKIPDGASEIFQESSSCARQSQRSEVSTSPVRHCECTRTSGATRPSDCPAPARPLLPAGPQPSNSVNGKFAELCGLCTAFAVMLGEPLVACLGWVVLVLRHRKSSV